MSWARSSTRPRPRRPNVCPDRPGPWPFPDPSVPRLRTEAGPPGCAVLTDWIGNPLGWETVVATPGGYVHVGRSVTLAEAQLDHAEAVAELRAGRWPWASMPRRRNPDPSLRDRERRWLLTRAPDDWIAYRDAARRAGRDLEIEALDAAVGALHATWVPSFGITPPELVACMDRAASWSESVAVPLLQAAGLRYGPAVFPVGRWWVTYPMGRVEAGTLFVLQFAIVSGVFDWRLVRGWPSGPVLVLGVRRSPVGPAGELVPAWPELRLGLFGPEWRDEGSWLHDAAVGVVVPGVELLTDERVRVAAPIAARWWAWRQLALGRSP